MEIPDQSQILYIRTDWSKYVMEIVILKADYSVEARKVEAK